LKVNPEKTLPFLKQNLHFVFAENNFESILDACKVADVILPVLSCRGTNMDGLTLDPQKNASAFDELGYKVLSALRV
jgi:pre-rRNA-processing protein TSR1